MYYQWIPIARLTCKSKGNALRDTSPVVLCAVRYSSLFTRYDVYESLYLPVCFFSYFQREAKV